MPFIHLLKLLLVKNPFLPDVLKAKWILAVSYNLKMQLGLARSEKHDKPKIVVSIHSSNAPKRDRMDKTIQTPPTICLIARQLCIVPDSPSCGHL
jgi:hypothetical protein